MLALVRDDLPVIDAGARRFVVVGDQTHTPPPFMPLQTPLVTVLVESAYLHPFLFGKSMRTQIFRYTGADIQLSTVIGESLHWFYVRLHPLGYQGKTRHGGKGSEETAAVHVDIHIS
jgi:hypothetical protein